MYCTYYFYICVLIKTNMMDTLNDFLIQKARPLPVIVAVDRSGSMQANGKIEALNQAMRDFVHSLQEEQSSRIDLQMAVYSFGSDGATEDCPLTSIQDIQLPNYQAGGGTPMGQVFRKIKALIDNKEKITSRAYIPTIVLLTDGAPTDNWEIELNKLIGQGRSAKAFRIALAIGEDADKQMLRFFVSTQEHLLNGENARDIKNFFRFVTMSVTQRMRSATPNQQVQLPPNTDDIIDF